ncbi:MAG TPA: hypothetical protein PLD62_03505, partial [Candidatus Cloacimonadota bacterium]|nr:hypothetical protein [Candidatus Cloacimonadota bacterium]
MKKTFFRMRRCQTSPCFSTSSLNQNATLVNVAFPATFRHVAFFFFLCVFALFAVNSFGATWQIK